MCDHPLSKFTCLIYLHILFYSAHSPVYPACQKSKLSVCSQLKYLLMNNQMHVAQCTLLQSSSMQSRPACLASNSTSILTWEGKLFNEGKPFQDNIDCTFIRQERLTKRTSSSLYRLESHKLVGATFQLQSYLSTSKQQHCPLRSNKCSVIW